VEVELILDAQYDSASAEADALFARARKLKRGSKVVSDLLEQTADAWNLLQEAQVDLQSALDANEVDHGRLALVQDRLTRSFRATNFRIPSETDSRSSATSSSSSNTSRRQSKPEIGTPTSNIRKLQSPGGCTVLVGRNRRGNENLSLAIARGQDIWMHSRGCPGAHVLIQNRRGGPTPTDECLQFAADLAIFYSDLRSENKAPVTAAEPKHLSKPRGAPLGAIKIREEWKTFVGRPDQVPEELKVAREESGQSNEYRSSDKAKHRRRTKQVAEEEKAKRKKALREKKN
jgi:predicted ribosome quality control (RQC) complex YloA/Tae2 family protein